MTAQRMTFTPLFCILLLLLLVDAPALRAQAIDPQKSAKAAALSDTRFIDKNIQDNQDAMILLQKAASRSANAGIRELAQQMTEDHTEMLYMLQELRSAGSRTSDANAGDPTGETHKLAADLDARLNTLSGGEFDTIWVANMFLLKQAKYDELSQAAGTVTNPQLKAAITAAIPKVRKHRDQLRILQKNLAKAAAQERKAAAQQKKQAAKKGK